jgi:PII-like signaling protein
VEIVDSEEKISHLLPFLDEVVADGMTTMEDIQILKYKGRESSKNN